MDDPWYGARDGEGPPVRLGPVGRVAVLADVHANVVALDAVLADVQDMDVDLVVYCGDLSWGPEPGRTIRMASQLGARAVFVRGVGLPYHNGPPGTAYWAVLGPTVDLRTSAYDIDAATARCRSSGDPSASRIVDLLLSPPGVDEVVNDAEQRMFAD